MARFTILAAVARPRPRGACSPIAARRSAAPINHEPVLRSTSRWCSAPIIVFDVAASGGVPAVRAGAARRLVRVDRRLAMATASRSTSRRAMPTRRAAPTSPASPPHTACCSATARRSPPAQVPPGTVRVIVSRTTATRPGLPGLDEDPQIGTAISDRTSSNYGCAHQFQPRGDDRRSRTISCSARSRARQRQRCRLARRSGPIATRRRPGAGCSQATTKGSKQ